MEIYFREVLLFKNNWGKFVLGDLRVVAPQAAPIARIRQNLRF